MFFASFWERFNFLMVLQISRLLSAVLLLFLLEKSFIYMFVVMDHLKFEHTDDRVPTELKKAIMQARMDKKLTQAQLSQVFIQNTHLSPHHIELA